MSKMTFKRVSLAVVAALGFGVLSSGPSSAAVVASSDTLTLSATTATVSVGETASVSITATFIAAAIGDSMTVNVVNQSAPTAATSATTHGLYVTDSANANIFTSAQSCAGGLATGTMATQQCGTGEANIQKDYGVRGGLNVGAAGTAYSSAVTGSFGNWQSGTKALSVTFAYRLMAPNAAGTYSFRAYLTSTYTSSTYSVVSVPVNFTITVTANSSTVASEQYSKVWLNGPSEYTNTQSALALNVTQVALTQLEADSALVVSAGTAASPQPVGVLFPIVENASDTKVASVVTTDAAVSNTRVKDSVTVTITGPGLLAVNSYWSGLSSTRAKQVTMDWKETVVVYSDGTAGTGTITSYIGGSVNNSLKFAQAAKTVTFVGRATTFTASAGASVVRAGSTILYNGATTNTNGGDSVTAGTAVVRFLAKDAAGNAVTTKDLSTGPGDAGGANFFAISSDTSVIAAGITAAARKSPALTCSYDADGTYVTAGYWYCSGNVFDSGTVTLTIVDSRTVTPNGANYLTTTTSAVYKSDAVSITFAGSGYTGTMALDKATYNVGEAATLTSTCKDTNGRNVADGNSNVGCFSNLNWASAAPTFSYNASVNATGGTFGTGATITSLIGYFAKATGGVSWLAGTDTALVYMPTVAGTYTLKGRTSGATTDSTLLTFTVVDPAQVAQGKAIADAQAAADAATDAALQAIDAANAATDAANLSAEAADAATVAAEEAKDAADAATAAVEALATQVATLMAALQAQIRSLANTVAKIAKKVKA